MGKVIQMNRTCFKIFQEKREVKEWEWGERQTEDRRLANVKNS